MARLSISQRLRMISGRHSRRQVRFAYRISMLLPLVFLTSALPLGAGVKLATPPGPIPRDYFGMHIHRAAKKTPWPAIEFGSWRLWDAGVPWAKLEPSKDHWDFSTLDTEVALAQQHGVELLMTFGKTPTWASSRPNEHTGGKAAVAGGASEPADLANWRNFVRTLAQRYKGRIQAYELWNEPNLPAFYTGTPDAMVAMARVAYATIKEVDPNAIVVSPSAVGPRGVSWLDSFLGAGGGKYVDVIGYHFYVRKQPPEAMVDRIREVQDVMERNGYGDKPLWNTETGRQRWGGTALADESPEAVAYVARAYILNWAAGVRRFYWYAWDDNGMAVRMTGDDESTPTPAASAYAQIEDWLVGANMKSCSNDGPTWVCELRRDSSPFWLVWNSNGNGRFAPPSSWLVTSVARLRGDTEQVRRGEKVQIGIVPSMLLGGAVNERKHANLELPQQKSRTSGAGFFRCMDCGN